MYHSIRYQTCSVVVAVLTLAFAVSFTSDAFAQVPASSSVETYVDQVQPSNTGLGVIPQGITWNQPLRAGDMVLPRAPKTKEKATTTPVPPSRNASAPVGDLRAPQLSASTATKPSKAPQIATSPSGLSTQGLMLLQGMKSALKQAGQNPDLPKSDLVPVDANDPAAKTEDSKVEPKEKLTNVLPSLPDTMAAGAKDKTAKAPQTLEAPAALAVPLKKTDGDYVAGQEPKGWVSPDKAAEAHSITAQGELKPADDGMMDIVFPPEMTGSTPTKASAAPVATNMYAPLPVADADTPKATEMKEQPVSLEHAPTKKTDGSGFLDRMTKPFTSIFGDPVDEADDTKKPDLTTPPTVAAIRTGEPAAKCEPKVEKWTRECADAGYPAHFVGHIVGETRIECPSGDGKDVWLNNTCAAPIGSSKYSIQDTGASDLTDEPAPVSSAVAKSKGSVIIPDADTSVDGACGVANGLAADSKPAGDLCAQGEATSVSGEGPWRWSCKGRKGGMTVSCAAPVIQGKDIKKTAKSSEPTAESAATEDGKCGEAASIGTETAPETGLCAKGVPSRVNGSGPWTWACSGVNGGVAVSCTASRKTDGVCGGANNTGTDTMPMRDLCTAGYASAVTGNGPWNWTCSGLHGGNAATCTAPARVNAVCGSASLTGHDKTPSGNLCSVGTASAVSGDGPWSWTCEGSNGGANVSCKADTMTNGACGPAHGNQYDKAPSNGLCSEGTPTRVTGLGPWNWNCTGSNGGVSASCTAALGTPEQVAAAVGCGEASETLALAEPTDKLCVSGAKASSVSGSGPWTWTCSDNAGHETKCSTLTASAGTCGKAANVTASTAPERNLCAAGTPSDVVAFEKKSWKWECKGSMGAASSTCYAPMKGGEGPSPKSETKATPAPAAPSAQCGKAAREGAASKPSADLCEDGKASSVSGNGPWTWTCGDKKVKVTCEAQKTADGTCGTANGSIQRAAPTSGLCASGVPTEVSGNGPWMWSCVGTGGGASSSCSAASQSQTKVDGTCGSAANAVMTQAPASGLCDSGVPSTVYGEGPWTWTCSGMNGGIASTCKTSKVVPKAPPPPGPSVNGVCGSANGEVATTVPDENLCAYGTATAVSGKGPWNWNCIGSNGGMTVSCTAPLMPLDPVVGACGSANGVPTLVAPKSGLCSAGIMSAVSGKGPWTWSCSGTNGGGAVSCVAPLAGAGAAARGLPSMVTPTLDTGVEAPAPKAAPVGLVTPSLPTGPLPALKPGTVPNLKTTKKKEKQPASSAVVPVLTPSSGASVGDLDAVAPTEKNLPGVKQPATDSKGNVPPRAKLILDADVATISFTRGSDQMDKDAIEIAEKLARILRANDQTRITLIAYSDTNGEITPREARRISLNRALAVRDFLVTKGVSTGRVDVRPMGANVPSGDMDRVDVKVN